MALSHVIVNVDYVLKRYWASDFTTAICVREDKTNQLVYNHVEIMLPLLCGVMVIDHYIPTSKFKVYSLGRKRNDHLSRER